MQTKYAYALIIALFLFSFALNYSIRQDHRLPIHQDEYDHLAIIKEMDKTGTAVNYDPYLTTLQFPEGRNFEINYDLFLLGLYQLTGLRAVHLAVLVPPLVAFLLTLSSFVLVRWLTQSDLAGLVSSIFVLFLHNNIALLGYWFLVPMALGVAAIPIISYLFLKGLEKWSYALLLILVLANITLVHAVYTVVFIPCFAIYLLINRQEIKRNWQKILAGSVVLFAVSNWFVNWNFFDLPSTFQQIADKLVWELWPLTKVYPIIDYLTPMMIVLALLGIIYLLMPWFRYKLEASKLQLKAFKTKRRVAKPAHDLKLDFPKLFLFFLALLFWIRSYADQFEICFLGPCRRTSPALSVMVLLIAGIGCWYLIKQIIRFIEGYYPEWIHRTNLQMLVFFALGLFILVNVLSQPFTHVENIYHPLEERELPLLDYIREQTPEYSLVFSLPSYSKPVFVVAERKVAGTIVARIGQEVEALASQAHFMSLDCPGKMKALEDTGASIVYVRQGVINCQGLDKLYTDGSYYVYGKS